MICALCGGPDATITTKRLNGLPVGMIACQACRDAVQRRDLGVTVDFFGDLHVYGTDGRGQTHQGVMS